MNKNNKIQIKEATGDSSSSRGSYVGPLQIGIRKFKKSQMGPFNIPVSKYDSPELEYDSYDGSMDEPKKQIKKLESKAKKITNYMTKHPDSTSGDEDGNSINQTPGKNKKIVPIKENSTANSAGEYNGPIELGQKKWRKSELFPFIVDVDNYLNKKSKGKHVKNNVKRVVGMWEKGVDGTYDIPTHDVHTVNEWVEIRQDTLLEDVLPDSLKTPSNYERVIDGFKNKIPQEYHHKLEVMFDRIKEFINDRGFNVKVINGCQTGYRGVRTRDAVILCSPESIPNLASFVYVLFHELKHEQQMSEFDLSDSYMGDIEDFEKFYKIYWDMELDADSYAKDWVKKIGNVLELPDEYYKLDQMITNYPMMSSMVKQMMTQLHNQVQKLKKQGMSYTDISDLDVVKRHLDKLEDMF
jgi:hypothetical protein